MSQIDTLLAEIEARAAKATAKEDTIARRMARINQRTDIPRLAAAMRVALDWITEDDVLDCIEAALKGDNHD